MFDLSVKDFMHVMFARIYLRSGSKGCKWIFCLNYIKVKKSGKAKKSFDRFY